MVGRRRLVIPFFFNFNKSQGRRSEAGLSSCFFVAFIIGGGEEGCHQHGEQEGLQRRPLCYEARLRGGGEEAVEGRAGQMQSHGAATVEGERAMG